jgi:hypothetical protein
VPVVLRSGGFVVAVFAPPREHRRPHVHVWKAGCELVIALDPILGLHGRMKSRDEKLAFRLVEDYQEFLLAAWRRLHG